MTTDLKQTAINVNLTEGSFSIEGSEDFVEKTLFNIQEYVSKNINIRSALKEITTTIPTQRTESNFIPENNKIETSIDEYIDAGIFYLDPENDSVQIITKVPGKNNTEKSINIVLIALHAKGGVGKVISNKEIADLCAEQSCLVSKNLSAMFKKKNGNFIRKDDGRKWTIQLTVPGKEAAAKLLEGMVSGGK